MKPQKLMMQAFGPYPKEEIIDFSILGEQSMFVISGKTGAGKTTIFDGICYAIYGKPSGDERGSTDLRSQFAQDDMQTEVSLEFSLKNKKYYIWRAPQQEKKKSRGDGYRTVSAQAELYLIEGEGSKQLLTANVRDVDEYMRALIQLDANQFRQILMIPQGEFRKLLISDSKDKEAILQKLFHTEFYKKIEEQLKQEASEKKQVIQNKILERQQQLHSVYKEEGSQLSTKLVDVTSTEMDILAAIEQDIAQKIEEHEKIKVSQQEAQNRRDQLQRERTLAKQILEQFEQRDRLQLEKERLTSMQPAMQDKEAEIKNSYRALKLEQQDQYCLQLKKELDSIVKEHDQQIITVEQLLKDEKTAKKTFEAEKANENERAEMISKISILRDMKDSVETFFLKQSLLKDKEATLNNITKNVTQLRQSLTQQEEKLDKVSAFLRQNDTVFEENFSLGEQLRELNDLQKNYQVYTEKLLSLDKASTNMNKEKEVLHALEQTLSDQKQTRHFLQQQRLEAQAAVLAESLVTSQSCPVCGSTEHPKPATFHHSVPLEEDIEAAEKQVTNTEQKVQVANNTFIKWSSNVESLTVEVTTQLKVLQSADPKMTETNIEEKQQEIATQKQKVLEQQKALQNLMKQISSYKQERIQLEQNIKSNRTTLDEQLQKEKMITEEITKITVTNENIQGKLPDGVHSLEGYIKLLQTYEDTHRLMEESLEKASSNLQELQQQIAAERATLNNMAEQQKRKQAQLQQEREKFVRLLEEQQFSNYKAYKEALRSSAEIEQLEAEVKEYAQQLRSVTDQYRMLEEKCSKMDKPDITTLEETFKQISEELLSIEAQLRQQSMHIEHNKNVVSQVNQINESIREKEKEYAVIGQLADIAKGQNTHRITFERFVLAAFLDDILQVANIRLSRMTNGRYEFLRKKERSKGNVQSGLELLVFDQFTGQERHVKTLSGGESFKAALALALGLADVVQQYAGGVSLETMFIDEGFGTLDPESLDQAIEILMDIQHSGRLVGIISHVPELKERIDARLEVVSTQNGSYTSFHVTT